MKILFVTPIRGFFKHLFDAKNLKANFLSNCNSFYEVNSTSLSYIKRLGRSKIFDLLGYIHCLKAKNKPCDLYASFNRFLKTDKPYFIYVENPTALYHYKLARRNSFLGSRRIDTLMGNHQLKALVYMSKVCEQTFERVCHSVRADIIQKQIYPLVSLNHLVNKEIIKNRCSISTPLKLLYIAQGSRFLSKGALEVIEAYKRLSSNDCNIQLTMVTSFIDVDKKALALAQSTKGIKVYDFKFSKEEMFELYASHNLLLIPSSDDSSPLTVLEAIKSGLPVLGSKLYAIPEMVQDGVNGFLTDPAWWFFDKDGIPNPKVWNHRSSTIYSGKRNENLVRFLEEKIDFLNKNRQLLENMSYKSLEISSSAPFSCEYIVSQWNELFYELEEGRSITSKV